ncbi:unnamed protein product, partial [Owenia fusiformis]
NNMKLLVSLVAFALYFAVASAQVNENLVDLLWTRAELLRQQPNVSQPCVNRDVFQALFLSYDSDDDMRVTREEFVPRWQANTNMTTDDVNALYDYIVITGGGSPNFIDESDIDFFYLSFISNSEGCISEVNYKARWREVIADLPDQGAQVPPARLYNKTRHVPPSIDRLR